MKSLEIAKFDGKYPIRREEHLLGYNPIDNVDEYDQRIFLYMGVLRIDVSDMKAYQIRSMVKKLELMGMHDERTK